METEQEKPDLEFRIIMLEELCKSQSKLIEELFLNIKPSQAGSIRAEIFDKASEGVLNRLNKRVPTSGWIVERLKQLKVSFLK